MAAFGLETHRAIVRNISGERMLPPELQAKVERVRRSGSAAEGIHSDDAAQHSGWKRALVGGMLVAAEVQERLVAAWGINWLERGEFSIKHVRPTYDGDQIEIRFSSRDATDGASVAFEVYDPSGQLCHVGHASLPKMPPPPPRLSEFAVHEREEPIMALPGRFGVGELLDSSRLTVTSELLERHHEANEGASSVYRSAGVVPLVILELLGGSLGSFVYPGLAFAYGSASRQFSLARVGDLLHISGRIARLWEKKGNHFYETESLIVANVSRPVALMRRSAVYHSSRPSAT